MGSRNDDNLEVVRMPFGKHMGTPLRSVPRAYLEWVVREVDGFSDLKRSIAVVIAEWDWNKPPLKSPKPAKPKKKARAPRLKTNEQVYGKRPDGCGEATGEPCPFDTDDGAAEQALDAEHRAIVG